MLLSKDEDMKPVVLGCVVGLLLALSSAQVVAQPLAEIARREKLRREALAAKAAAENVSLKVYTNADLRGGGRLTTSSGQTSAPAASAEGSAATPTAEGTPETDGAAAAATEDQWRNRINAVRQARDRAQLMVAALQNRVDGLWTEFTSRDDPAQRAVIEQDRQAALDELENTSAEIEDLTQQIADIQEEARQANVPPGWLR